MRTSLRPYPRYQETAHPWLGTIPFHWKTFRLKQVAKVNPSRGEASRFLTDDPMVTFLPMESVGTDGRIDAREQRPISTVWNGFTYFRRGDVIVAKITPCFENGKGACLDELPTLIGFGSTELIVLRPSGAVLPQFLYRMTTHAEFRARGADSMTGSAGQQRVPTDFVGNYSVPVPPLEEQAAIVRFLNYTDQEIRRFIQAKRHVVGLLEEQRRTIVEKVVTRGLNPNTRLRASGVDWLGDVPNHWTVASLRFRYDQCLGKMVDAKKATGKHLIPYLRNIDVRWDSINTHDLPLIDIMPHECERFTVKVGDLLVCEGRHLGRCAFWDGQIEVCGFQKALHRLRPLNPETDNPRFLYYCLYLAHIKDAFDASSTDNSIPHLTGEMLRAHKFPFPPLEEQTAIAAYLDYRFEAIKKAMSTIQGEISLLLEYRTRLIADVVTGKLDVCETAERLPSSAGQEALDDKSLDLAALNPEEADALDDDPELLPVAADEE